MDAGSRTIPALSYHGDVLSLPNPLTVRAVFDRAMHLETVCGSIVTITVSPYNGPLTVRIAPDAWRSLVVHSGDSVSLQRVAGRSAGGPRDSGPRLEGRHGGAIEDGRPYRPKRAPSALVTGSATVLLDPGREWRAADPCRLPGRRAGLSYSRFRADATVLFEASRLAARGGLDAGILIGSDPPGSPAWLRHGREHGRGLSLALQHCALRAIREHAGALVGLGPGLTPSGDDLLCGLLAGLRLLGSRRAGGNGRQDGTTRARYEAGSSTKERVPVGEPLSALAQAIEESRGRTTALSRTLLWYAAGGIAVEPVLSVLWSLGGAKADASGSIPGLDALLRIGHSSGSDMLTGVLMAIMAVLAWEEGIAPSLGSSA